MCVLHATCEPGARWEYPLPPTHSLTLYVRRGPLDVVVGGGKAVRLATYETAFFKVCGGVGVGGMVGREERLLGSLRVVSFPPPLNTHTHHHKKKQQRDAGERLVVQAPATAAGGHKDGADVLVMAGEPLREPILASGPFVESDAQQVGRWVLGVGMWLGSEWGGGS